MRYLRHGPTAIWAAALAFLLIMAVIGFTARAGGSSSALALTAPQQAPRLGIDALMTDLPSLYPAVAAGTGTTWARDFAATARQARTDYETSGGRLELTESWRAVTTAADQLAIADPLDKQAFLATAGQLGAAVAQLQSEYYGKPVVLPQAN